MIKTLIKAGCRIDSVDVSTFGLYNYYRLIQKDVIIEPPTEGEEEKQDEKQCDYATEN